MPRYAYRLVTPTGPERPQTVDAESRTAARREIARAYRDETPRSRYGFAPWRRVRIEWLAAVPRPEARPDA